MSVHFQERMELQRCREELNVYKRRTEQLEKEIIDRDRRLLVLREECVHAREESSSKTKLVIQLQKQLVEMERFKSTSSSGSGGGSLFGTLLGAASGEAVELARVKKEFEIQKEELYQKISQNQALQVRCVDLQEEQDRDKQKLTSLMEMEVKRANRVQKELLRKQEELEVIRTQNEVLSRDIGDRDRQIHDARTESAKLRLEKQQTERQRDRALKKCELELNLRMPPSVAVRSSTCLGFKALQARHETILALGDIVYWLTIWRRGTEPSLQAAAKLLVDTCADIRDSFPTKVKDLDPLNRACGALSSRFPFAKTFVIIYARTKPSSASWEFLKALSDELSAGDDAVGFAVKAVLEIAHVWRVFHQEYPHDDELSIEQAVKEYTKKLERMVLVDPSIAPSEVKKRNADEEPDIHLQSDESFLISLEDLVHPKPLPLAAILKPSAPLVSWDSVETTEPVSNGSDTSAKDLKAHYHQLSLNNMNKIADLKQELAQVEQRAAEAEARVHVLEETQDVTFRLQQASKTVVQRAKDELEGTKESYDSQLKNFTERIVELERDLKIRNDEINQLRAERVLVNQLKKTIMSTHQQRS